LNVTNDAWFGESGGPHQHLLQAQFRAIETGMPLIRVANTGISAVFDGYGRAIGELKLGTEGTLDTVLPRSMPATLYASWGDSLFFLVLLATAALLAFVSLRAR